MFQSDVQTLRVGIDRSCPSFARSLWENKSSPTSQEDSDPILFTDPWTGRTWEGMLLLLTGRNEGAFSDNDGDLWVPSQGARSIPVSTTRRSAEGPCAPAHARPERGRVSECRVLLLPGHRGGLVRCVRRRRTRRSDRRFRSTS